ncbi:hypothetical protein DPMN_156858 [Dreissena polymorpha]|uniref:Uncharacterized protein n=1 Tax=Dreissena polymorpha TaxID=45954 RepID=A0A9D4FRF3_DREPO|nr:hypothetical protein DPMN_156858 [Dreissena polymorpha]
MSNVVAKQNNRHGKKRKAAFGELRLSVAVHKAVMGILDREGEGVNRRGRGRGPASQIQLGDVSGPRAWVRAWQSTRKKSHLPGIVTNRRKRGLNPGRLGKKPMYRPLR